MLKNKNLLLLPLEKFWTWLELILGCAGVDDLGSDNA
jgi:hypothetical protein